MRSKLVQVRPRKEGEAEVGYMFQPVVVPVGRLTRGMIFNVNWIRNGGGET